MVHLELCILEVRTTPDFQFVLFIHLPVCLFCTYIAQYLAEAQQIT